MTQPLTPLFQSNAITHSLMAYTNNGGCQPLTLWQQKIIAMLIYFLQPLVRLKMQGGSITEAFPSELNYDANNAVFRFCMDLKNLTTHEHYAAACHALEILQSGLKIILPSKYGKCREEISMIIVNIDRQRLKDDGNYKDSIVFLEIAKRPALAIADITLQSGKAVEFTKWYYEVSMNARSKYTQKLYWLLASWRNTGVFKITLDELKEALGIERTQFSAFNDFKKRVLLPVSHDLKNSDCPLDLNKVKYIKNEKGKITALEIKTGKPSAALAESNLYVRHIVDLLKKYFGFQAAHVEEILPLLLAHSGADEGGRLFSKLSELHTMFQKGKIRALKSMPNYVIRVVKNMFHP